MSAVKELSEAVEFVCALVAAVVEASDDGKITLGDTKHIGKQSDLFKFKP